MSGGVEESTNDTGSLRTIRLEGGRNITTTLFGVISLPMDRLCYFISFEESEHSKALDAGLWSR